MTAPTLIHSLSGVFFLPFFLSFFLSVLGLVLSLVHWSDHAVTHALIGTIVVFWGFVHELVGPIDEHEFLKNKILLVVERNQLGKEFLAA